MLECYEPDDGTTSPIYAAAQMIMDKMSKRGKIPLAVNGLMNQEHSPGDALSILGARLVMTSTDPNMKIPTEEELKKSKGRNPQALFMGFLMSQLRVSEVTVVLMALNFREKSKEVVKAWVGICNALIKQAKMNISGLKPLRLILADAHQSVVMKQIKEEHEDLLVLTCPTGEQYCQQNPTESAASAPKKAKKDGKKKEGAA